MNFSWISCTSVEGCLPSGTVSLFRGNHGWRLCVVREDCTLWRVSSYVVSVHACADDMLVVNTSSGNVYYFTCVECTTAEAIDKFNKVVGLSW